MRWLAVLSVLFAVLWASSAAAQGPRYFYCYAQDPETGTVFVSDAHDVGPVSERAGYGSAFSGFLSSKGKVPAGTQAYCTMQATKAEIERGIADLANYCSGCTNPARFEDIVWPRGGKTITNLLAGRLPTRKAVDDEPEPAERPDELPEGAGVFVLGRLDQTDVVFTANEDNGQMLTRYKADLRGGKWTTILSNDRCRGWLAIAHASNAADRVYFVARGADSEGAASRAALASAEEYAGRRGPDWSSGVLFALTNDYRAPGADYSKGLIEAVKGEVRKLTTRDCGVPVSPVGSIRG